MTELARIKNEQIERIPLEFASLKEYVTFISKDCIVFVIPVGVVKYDRDMLMKFFKQVDFEFNYYPPLDSMPFSRFEDTPVTLPEPKLISHTITCQF